MLLMDHSTIFRPETLSHRLKLYGGGSARFDSSVKSLDKLCTFAEQYLPGTTRIIKDSSNSNVIMASTPLMTKKISGDGPRYNDISVPVLYQFPSSLSALISSGKFSFTEDNIVEYSEVEVRGSGRCVAPQYVATITYISYSSLAVSSNPVSPLLFRVGQLVTATISIRASRGKNGTWFIHPHLHSLVLVGRKGSMVSFPHIFFGGKC